MQLHGCKSKGTVDSEAFASELFYVMNIFFRVINSRYNLQIVISEAYESYETLYLFGSK